jgi:predicted ABC-type ATPase
MTRPSVIVLGGANGSRKTTAATRLLRDELQVMEFVNADLIAKGLSSFQPEAHAVAAARVM